MTNAITKTYKNNSILISFLTSSSALLVSLLLNVCSSSSRNLRNSSSKSETRVFSLSRRISSDRLPSRKISFSLRKCNRKEHRNYTVSQKKTSPSLFLRYFWQMSYDYDFANFSQKHTPTNLKQKHTYTDCHISFCTFLTFF